jgi:hypothetical protein
MTTMAGERRSSQASATWAGVAPRRSAGARQLVVAAEPAGGQREVGDEHDALGLAVGEDLDAAAVEQVETVLHGRDRRHLPRAGQHLRRRA